MSSFKLRIIFADLSSQDGTVSIPSCDKRHLLVVKDTGMRGCGPIINTPQTKLPMYAPPPTPDPSVHRGLKYSSQRVKIQLTGVKHSS